MAQRNVAIDRLVAEILAIDVVAAVGAMALLALACGAVFAGAAAHKEAEEGTEAAPAAAEETGLGPTL